MYCKELFKKIKQSIPEKLWNEFEHFNRNYFLERTLFGNSDYPLVDVGKQTCRFCQKQEVTFNKDAHVIPALMSTAKVLSNFECDGCNEMFGNYERDFGEYFSMARTIEGLPNRKGKIPIHRLNSGFTIQDQTDPNIFNEIDVSSKNKRILIFKDKPMTKTPLDINQIWKLNNVRKPYKPINVFRVFLKIGFSLIEKEELDKFEEQRKFLENESFNIPKEEEYKDETISINVRKSDILCKTPVVYLFTKKENGMEWYADKTLIIFWGKTVFQIPIFSNRNLKYFRNFYTLGYAPHPIIVHPYTNRFISNEKFLNALNNSNRKLVNFYCSRLVKDDIVSMVLKSKGPAIKLDENFKRI